MLRLYAYHGMISVNSLIVAV